MAGDRIVAEFDKNSQEKIRASVQEWKGKRILAIRTWYRDLADQQLKPGRNGITLSVDHFGEFRKLVETLAEQIHKDG